MSAPVGQKPARRLDFALPGTWSVLMLTGTDEEVRRAVHRFVESEIGRADDRAMIRADLRNHLWDSARRGRSIGARQMHFASSLFGIPFPVSLTITWPAFTLSEVAERPADERASRLDGLLSARGSTTVVQDPVLGIVRTTSVKEWEATDGNGESARMPLLEATYWLSLPDDGSVVLFSFSSALTQLKEPLMELLDAVIATVRPAGPSSR